MGIFGQIQAPVRGIIRQLTRDKDLRVVVQYKRYVGRVWSEADGTQVTTFSTTSINAVRLSHTAQSKFIGVGEIQLGDQLYLLDFRDAPTGMSLKDEILDENGLIQKVKQVEPIFGLAVAVTVAGGTSGV